NLIPFPPGHFYDSNTKTTTRYFKPTWWDGDKGEVPHNEVDYTELRESLEAAVKKRLMSEVPYGVLLSGGLDSSGHLCHLILSLAQDIQNMDEANEAVERATKDLQTRIELTLSCQSLPKLDFLSQTDAKIVCYLEDGYRYL
ncbi:MAG: hypothetical protein EOP04_28690, partial [Proteobacteria bacterium]